MEKIKSSGYSEVIPAFLMANSHQNREAARGWRRRAGAGQRGVLVAWVSSAGERGRAVSPGAASCRANVSADAVSSWLHWHWWSRAWDGDGGWGRERMDSAGGVGAGLTVFRGQNTPSWLSTEQSHPHRGEVRWEWARAPGAQVGMLSVSRGRDAWSTPRQPTHSFLALS